MRVLVVEDDSGVAGFVRRGLTEEGFAVDVAADGREAFRLALDHPYDVIVLDLMIPHMDGLEVLREVRKHGSRTPVLILSARDDVDQKVAGLNAGADDYLGKPFAFEELLARLRALLRRSSDSQDTILQAGDLTVDVVKRRVMRGERKVDLSPKEFALLEYLLRNQGNVLTRTMIAEHVWDQHFDSFSNVIDVYIRYLRAKVDEGSDQKLIRTIRGVGYVITDEPEQGS